MNITFKGRSALNKSYSLRVQYLLTSRCFNQTQAFKEDNTNTISKDVSNIKKFKESEDHTWVGPPHPVSNLRLKIFPTSKYLTEEEIYFYKKSKETQEWNQLYWEAHNKEFEKSKRFYVEKISKERKLDSKSCLTAEDMAPFYQEFSNKNYEKHISYNWKWYKRNFELLYLSAIAQISKLKKLTKKGVA